MTIRLKLLITLLGVHALLPSISHAIQVLQEDEFLLSAEQSLDEETWLTALSIDVQGTVNDSLFFAAQNVKGSGIFKESVWGIGTLVHFSGQAEDHVRLAAQRTITITGSFAKNLMAFAPAVQIISNATVQGDTVIAGKNILAKGTFNGDLNLFAAEAAIGGHIKGTLKVTANELTLMPGTTIDGDLIYIMPRELLLTPGITLNGALLRNKEDPKPISGNQHLIALVASKAAFFVGSLMVGFIMLSLFPVYTGVSISMAQQHRFRCFWTGMAGFFLLPLIALFTFASVFGIPLSIMLLCAFTITLYCGKLITGLAIGTFLIKKSKYSSLWQLFGAMTLGTGILYILFLLPIIGQAIWMTATFTGMGAIMMQLVQGQRRWMNSTGTTNISNQETVLEENNNPNITKEN